MKQSAGSGHGGAWGETGGEAGGESGGRGGAGKGGTWGVLGNRMGVLQEGWAGGNTGVEYGGGCVWGMKGVTSTGTGRVTGCSGSDLLSRGGDRAGPGPLVPVGLQPPIKSPDGVPSPAFPHPRHPPSPDSRALPPFPLPPTSARSESRSQKGKEVRTGARAVD